MSAAFGLSASLADTSFVKFSVKDCECNFSNKENVHVHMYLVH